MNQIRLSLIGSITFVIAGIHATIDTAHPHAFVILSLVEFFVGTIVCGYALWRAVDRSRTEEIGIGGLFFASGCAPARVQRILVGSFALQCIASIVFASLRIHTTLAFGVLSPMWTLGFTGLWSALHGTFPDREPELTRAGRRDASLRAHRASMPAARDTRDADGGDDTGESTGSKG